MGYPLLDLRNREDNTSNVNPAAGISLRRDYSFTALLLHCYGFGKLPGTGKGKTGWRWPLPYKAALLSGYGEFLNQQADPVTCRRARKTHPGEINGIAYSVTLK